MSEGEAYLLAKDLEGYKNDLRFLDIMELWYRDLLTAKSLREEGYLIQRDKKDAIFRAAKEPAALLAKKNRTNASGTECKFSADDGSHADGFKGDW